MTNVLMIFAAGISLGLMGLRIYNYREEQRIKRHFKSFRDELEAMVAKVNERPKLTLINGGKS